MFDITYNGEARSVEEGLSIADLLRDSGVTQQFCAVELNESIVPKTQFSSVFLSQGDSVEVVKFVGGG